MFVPAWILIVAGLIVGLLIALLLRRGSAARGHLLRPPRGLGASVRTSAAAPTSLPPELDREVRALMAAKHKIEAIKLVRERTGLGLKEAKDLVERM